MNGFKSFLTAIGNGFEKTLAFFASAKGQQLEAGVDEAANLAAGLVNPALPAVMTGIENLVHNGLASAAVEEANAAAAGMQAGTGVQKLAAVVTSLTPGVGSFLQSVGVSDATDTEVENLATVLGGAAADILNAIPARATGVPASTAAPAASTAPVEVPEAASTSAAPAASTTEPAA